MMLAWRAWMVRAGGAVVFVPLIRLAAHSLLGNDWRAGCRRLRRAAMCGYGCGGSSLLLGLSFRRRGGLFACGLRRSPGGLMVSVVLLRLMRGRPRGRACFICHGVVIALSLLTRVRIMSRRGVMFVPIVGVPWRRICLGWPVLVLSSSHPSHHLVRRWRFCSHRLRVPPHQSVSSLLIGCGYRAADGGRCLTHSARATLVRPRLVLV